MRNFSSRIIFTIALLIVVRIGAHITLPGIDAAKLAEVGKTSDNSLFGLYDMFVGGAFSKAAIFALGIMPYISSSIIIQLLGAVFPYFQKLQKEGEEGRKKINQLTRLGTIPVAALQAWGVSVQLYSRGVYGDSVIISRNFSFCFYAVNCNIFNSRNNFYDVAWRTDNRTGNWKWNFIDYIYWYY